MNQIVHIFRKDVRRHWPEIGLSIGVMAVYTWQESSHPTERVYPLGWEFFLR